jgi:hypothetical protein
MNADKSDKERNIKKNPRFSAKSAAEFAFFILVTDVTQQVFCRGTTQESSRM